MEKQGVDLTTKLGPLELKNPVLVSSGTFGTGEEFVDFFDINQLGGLITKAVTLEARPGNPPPRIAETPSGMLNAIGLENAGVERFIKEKIPFLRELNTAVIVNIAGSTVDEYVKVAERLTEAGGMCAFELNISCPNVKRGGMSFGIAPAPAAELVSAVRKATALPLIVKLSPNVTDIVEIGRAAADSGADILSATNTYRGMAIDINTRRPVLGNVIGGLSGPAIRPLAVYSVYQVSYSIGLPVLGMGGIMEAAHAIEFMLAGAAAVSVGTANLVDPLTPLKIIEGIREYCRENGIENPAWLTGRAHAGRASEKDS
jgi:dihydroorotate dehydrogenase (NAD+) catalytic subunit